MKLLYELCRNYLLSLIGGWRNRQAFSDVRAYCMFIGYPRSGHSLIGALLDAHPNMVIAHELGDLKYIYAGFSRNQIYYLLLQNSRKATRQGWRHRDFPLQVPGQWQGRFQRLLVIGDKHGEGAALRLHARPWLFDALLARMGKIKFIHVVRNPYDNIATIFNKSKDNLYESIEYYFSLCQEVWEVRRRVAPEDFFELRHEAFVEHPGRSLEQLCRFLDVNAFPDYIESCARIVYGAPHRSRHDLVWDAGHRAEVERGMAHFPFLSEYSFTD
jgi:hypothetical protein